MEKGNDTTIGSAWGLESAAAGKGGAGPGVRGGGPSEPPNFLVNYESSHVHITLEYWTIMSTIIIPFLPSNSKLKGNREVWPDCGTILGNR